jgi:hypothetical protein
MSTKDLSIALDRSALRALYDQAVDEINTSRNGILTTNFYAKTGDAIFNAGYLALSDAATGTRRMHTVSAPAGAGKTSFSYALIAAVHRYAETTPNGPYGIVFVVDQIDKADKVYCDLNALMPGKVAIWTRDHDRHCKKPERVENPAARFVAEELRHYPIIVSSPTSSTSAPEGTMRAALCAKVFLVNAHSPSLMRGRTRHHHWTSCCRRRKLYVKP